MPPCIKDRSRNSRSISPEMFRDRARIEAARHAAGVPITDTKMSEGRREVVSAEASALCSSRSRSFRGQSASQETAYTRIHSRPTTFRPHGPIRPNRVLDTSSMMISGMTAAAQVTDSHNVGRILAGRCRNSPSIQASRSAGVTALQFSCAVGQKSGACQGRDVFTMGRPV